MERKETSRRGFLKLSSLGIAAASIRGVRPRTADAAWTDGMQINPAIPNDRIVCCHDNEVFPGFPTDKDGALAYGPGGYPDGEKICNEGVCVTVTRSLSGDPIDVPIDKARFAEQNNALDTARIEADLDACAVALSGTSTPSEAWSTIFMNGARNWSDIKVALLLDTTSLFPVHVPIVGKLCTVLTGLGVPTANIILYDGQGFVWDYEDQAVTSGIRYLYEPYLGNGIPEGVVVSNGFDALGGLTAAPVPEPFPGDFLCAKSIADGAVDIIVNMATNKSHGDLVNDAALCLYNHFGGTFVRQPRDVFEGMDILNYMMAVNKSEAVVGGTPPRQQLCIIDSIWGNHCCGPYGTHLSKYTLDRQPNRLIMGTCAPLVDAVTIEKLRRKMSAHVEGFSQRFMIDFGFPAEKWDELDFTPVSV